MKSKDLGNLGICRVSREECHILTIPKYLFLTDLILNTISSLTSDLKKWFKSGPIFGFTREWYP